MFSLHETTQRRVCRIIFLVLCVVPTLLTLAGVAYCNRPWRQSDWQQTLASRLHLQAELDNVSRPRPGITTLTNLRMADLQSSLTIGSIETVRISRKNSRLVLKADNLLIQAEQLSDLADSFFAWLATNDKTPLEFHVGQLEITGQTWQSVQLSNVSIRHELSRQGTQQTFIIAQDSKGNQLKIELEYANNMLSCAIDGQRSQLPAWLVGELVPGLSGCGESLFSGVIVSKLENQQFNGKLHGTFHQVDLQQWVGAECPHRLQGLAEFELEELRWSGGRINFARGKIGCDGGAASQSLFDSAQKLCGCVPGRAWETLTLRTPDDLVSFDRLGLRFEMSPSGIVFAGQCANAALMTKGQLPLMQLQQPAIIMPVGRLVLLLSSDPSEWLPATRDAHNMTEDLPLPGDTVDPPSAKRE